MLFLFRYLLQIIKKLDQRVLRQYCCNLRRLKCMIFALRSAQWKTTRDGNQTEQRSPADWTNDKFPAPPGMLRLKWLPELLRIRSDRQNMPLHFHIYQWLAGRHPGKGGGYISQGSYSQSGPPHSAATLRGKGTRNLH